MSDHTGGSRVLLLGGTAEARELADAMHRRGIEFTSSLAGRVAQPRLPVGDVRIGGFGGADGLSRWLIDHRASVVVDATHPFARRISATAAQVCGRLGVPLLRLRRAPWTAGDNDRWITVPDIASAAEQVGVRGGRVFLTTGRQDAHAFAHIDSAWFLIRVVDPPTGALPPEHLILTSRGPYRCSDERAIMLTHRIDLLVTKNSGGQMTRGKLDAAAELGIDVVMVASPDEPAGSTIVDSVNAAVDWVLMRTEPTSTPWVDQSDSDRG